MATSNARYGYNLIDAQQQEPTTGSLSMPLKGPEFHESQRHERRALGPACLRRLSFPFTAVDDVEEAFYAYQAKAEWGSFLMHILIGILSPFSLIVLFMLKVQEMRDIRATLAFMKQSNLFKDSHLYGAFWYPALVMYLAADVRHEVVATEVGFPLLFFSFFLVYVSAKYGLISTDARVAQLLARCDLAVRVARHIERNTGTSNVGLAQHVQTVLDDRLSRLSETMSPTFSYFSFDVYYLDEELNGIELNLQSDVGIPFGKWFRCLDDPLTRRLGNLSCFFLKIALTSACKMKITYDQDLTVSALREWDLPQPSDRRSFRSMERLKISGMKFPVVPVHLSWPHPQQKIVKPSWLSEYVEQYENGGSVDAFVLAQQLLCGLSFERDLTASVIHFVRLLFDGLLLASVAAEAMLPDWFRPNLVGSFHFPQSSSARYIHFVWAWFVFQGSFCALVLLPRQAASSFSTLADAHEALNRMFTPAEAAKSFLPYVRSHILDDLVAWVEIRNAIHYFHRRNQLVLERSLAFILVGLLPLLFLMAYYASQPDWAPGLFTFSMLYVLSMLALNMPLVLYQGMRLNSTAKDQIEILSRLHCTVVRSQAFDAVCQSRSSTDKAPHSSAAFSDGPGIERLVATVVQELRFVEDNIVKLFGIKLTSEGLVPIASVFYSLLFFIYRQLGNVEYLKNLF